MNKFERWVVGIYFAGIVVLIILVKSGLIH